MPLPAPGPREGMHFRKIDMQGYRRPDGLYEIEGRLTDTKSEPFTVDVTFRTFAPGNYLHDMSVRLVVDDDLLVHEACACTDASPYGECPQAAPGIARLKGARIESGWRAAIQQRLGGAEGCTHMRELLFTMGSAAYQTLAPLRRNKNMALDLKGHPVKIDSCLAYRSGGELTMHKLPAFYTGLASPESKRSGR